ncbi:MAG: hypothetical protein QGG48_05745, partial [Desulfatiglandales bacterium]|nr:hypothetical protein [Desulfatiglandales bacterium]
ARGGDPKISQFTRGTRIDRAENTLHLSKLFDWFQSGFIQKSGSVIDLVRPYLREEVVRFFDRKPKVDFLNYN